MKIEYKLVVLSALAEAMDLHDEPGAKAIRKVTEDHKSYEEALVLRLPTDEDVTEWFNKEALKLAEEMKADAAAL
jgi:hypothetical protein